MAVRALRLGARAFGAGELVVMAVIGGPAERADRAAALVHAAVAEGADIVDLVDAGGPSGGTGLLVAAVREAHPELVIGVSTERAEVAREAAVAGADLLCGSEDWLAEVAAALGVGVAGPLAGATRAVAAGVDPERIIVVGSTDELPDVVAGGWPVLISLTGRETAASLAVAAVAAWLGVRVFRVEQVLAVRRALAMVSAIRGDIPPAHAVRGLALGPVSTRAE